MNDVLLLSEKSQSMSSIRCSQEALGELTKLLPFLHSFSGCDTVSSAFSKGKNSWFKEFKANDGLRCAGYVLSDKNSNKDQVEEASVQCFKIIYGGKKHKTLSGLR